MPEENTHTVRLKVMLLSNYEPDAQESMERFARMLADGLKKNGHLVQMIRPGAILASSKTKTGLNKWLGYVDKYLLFPPSIKEQVKWADIVHICDHSSAVYLYQLQHVANLVTCHDLLAVRAGLGEETFCPLTPMGRMLQRWILHGLRRACLIACDSQSTKRDVERLLLRRDRIRLVRLGLNYPFSVLAEKESAGRLRHLSDLNAGQPFVLHVGSSLLRKNRDGVLRIFARIKDRFQGQLVFAGAPLTTELMELSRDLGVADRVVVVNKPDDAVLEALYNSALVLLFPSRGEGFGWPIIEAQACGCPVISSQCSSCPEVAGADALLHELDDEAGFAASVLRLIDRAERAKFVQLGFDNLKKFNTDEMVAAYISLYREAIELSKAHSKQDQPSINSSADNI